MLEKLGFIYPKVSMGRNLYIYLPGSSFDLDFRTFLQSDHDLIKSSQNIPKQGRRGKRGKIGAKQ